MTRSNYAFMVWMNVRWRIARVESVLVVVTGCFVVGLTPLYVCTVGCPLAERLVPC